MTKEFIAAGFAIAMTLPAAALAADYAAMDADGDGYISMAEFQEAMPDATSDTFMAADTDGDGVLSAEEIAAAQDAGILPASDS